MIYFIFFLLFSASTYANERIALVSMAPYVEMVDELTNKEVRVELLVPAGFNAHTYEPTPKQILNAAKASIWFTIGELFEERAQKALKAENPKLAVIDLRQGLSLMDGHEHDDGHICSADTHIWMSPKMMVVQVELMAKSLEKVFPELASSIQDNKGKLVEKLNALDSEIHAILDSHKGEVIYVSHPAYGYFCREYGLHQESIEFEGKDPSPKHLYNLIEEAKEDKVRTIFTQKQYSTKAAELVAKEVHAKISLLDPYSEHYFTSMMQIAKSFAEAG
jgi:zinc transport system substrate-binding protein